MATRDEIIQALYDDCASYLGSLDGSLGIGALSSPYEHVEPSETYDEETLPSITFTTSERAYTRGFDGNVHVDDVDWVNGSIDSITYRADWDLRIDLSVHVDDGDVTERDKLLDGVRNYFNRYNRHLDESDFHSDAHRFDVRESSPTEGHGYVNGERVRLDVRYGRYNTFDSVPTMEQITLEFDVDEDDVVDRTETI